MAIIIVIAAIVDNSIGAYIFGALSFLIYVYFGYTLLKRRVPKGLEIVEEEES